MDATALAAVEQMADMFLALKGKGISSEDAIKLMGMAMQAVLTPDRLAALHALRPSRE